LSQKKTFLANIFFKPPANVADAPTPIHPPMDELMEVTMPTIESEASDDDLVNDKIRDLADPVNILDDDFVNDQIRDLADPVDILDDDFVNDEICDLANPVDILDDDFVNDEIRDLADPVDHNNTTPTKTTQNQP
jgi:hypothetical protein